MLCLQNILTPEKIYIHGQIMSWKQDTGSQKMFPHGTFILPSRWRIGQQQVVQYELSMSNIKVAIIRVSINWYVFVAAALSWIENHFQLKGLSRSKYIKIGTCSRILKKTTRTSQKSLHIAAPHYLHPDECSATVTCLTKRSATLGQRALHSARSCNN